MNSENGIHLLENNKMGFRESESEIFFEDLLGV